MQKRTPLLLTLERFLLHPFRWMCFFLQIPLDTPCGNCYNDEMSNEDLNRYSLDCAMFMPLYLNFSLLPEKTICKILSKSVEKFEDSNKEKSNLNTVGYELGLLLYLLSKRKMVKEAEFVFDKLMSQINDQNVWVEYYCDNKPSERSCPYRPWESAINLTGIVEFLQILNK